MGGGIIVTASVVGALALFETVLPWVFAALRKWRSRTEEAGGVRTQLPCGDSNLTLPQSATSSLAQGGTRKPCALSASSLRQSENESILNEEENAEARQLWEEARGMTHRFTPDWEKDQEYLSKIYAAARLGHLEAMTKLGEYAGRRGAVVEAFYWTLLAELKGAKGLKVQLRELRLRWQALGCPDQYRNAYRDFTEEQGVFARAVLRLQCGVNPQYARARLKELAERGVEEARLFLEI